jgi:hypothetical protein
MKYLFQWLRKLRLFCFEYMSNLSSYAAVLVVFLGNLPPSP